MTPDDGPDMVNACPKCDTSQIHRRRGVHFGGPATDGKRYRCPECPHTFNTPARRPRRHGEGVHPDSLVGRLLDADPDDVGRSAMAGRAAD